MTLYLNGRMKPQPKAGRSSRAKPDPNEIDIEHIETLNMTHKSFEATGRKVGFISFSKCISSMTNKDDVNPYSNELNVVGRVKLMLHPKLILEVGSKG